MAHRVPYSDQPEERTKLWLLALGTPESDVDELYNIEYEAQIRLGVGGPDALLEDGEIADVPGWSLRVGHTPGHTPGHICLYAEHARAVFTGDHILPRVTPNVSTFEVADWGNPLRDYFASLSRMRQFRDDLVPPAHEWPFTGLDGRISALSEHHEERLEELRTVLGGGAMSPWAAAQHMSWKRTWHELGHGRRLALGETHAHLLELEARGQAQRLRSDPSRWALA